MLLRRAAVAARVMAVALAAVALGAGGLWLGLRTETAGTYPSQLGTVQVRVGFAVHGAIEAYVPLADWGIRTHPFSAPLMIHVEPRTLDRSALLRAAGGDRHLLAATEHDLRTAARAAVLRAVRYALGAVALLALISGLVLQVAGARRRLALGVPAAALLLAVGGTGLALWRAASSWDSRALSHITYYARGAELRQLLDAASKARSVGDSYAGKVEQTVRSFAALLTGGGHDELTSGRTFVLASDLHGNRLALRSLGGVIGRDTVFMPGDFGQDGSETEAAAVVSGLRRLRGGVVAVSGNHDSARLMLRLARAGALVLTTGGELTPGGRVDPSRKVVDVGGLSVAGFSDPLEWRGANPSDPRRVFSIAELPDPAAALVRARDQVLAWWQGLPRAPDVVLIHEWGLAYYLATMLHGAGYSRPLTILTGHDHYQHVNAFGANITVADGGTVGAGGMFGIGGQPVGFADLHFDARRPLLRAVDLVRVEPVSGASQADRVVIAAGSCPTGSGDICQLSGQQRTASTSVAGEGQ